MSKETWLFSFLEMCKTVSSYCKCCPTLQFNNLIVLYLTWIRKHSAVEMCNFFKQTVTFQQPPCALPFQSIEQTQVIFQCHCKYCPILQQSHGTVSIKSYNMSKETWLFSFLEMCKTVSSYCKCCPTLQFNNLIVLYLTWIRKHSAVEMCNFFKQTVTFQQPPCALPFQSIEQTQVIFLCHCKQCPILQQSHGTLSAITSGERMQIFTATVNIVPQDNLIVLYRP